MKSSNLGPDSDLLDVSLETNWQALPVSGKCEMNHMSSGVLGGT